MNRAEFLKSLGLSGAALMAVYCTGGLTACSSEEPAPASTGGIDFSLALGENANSALANNGGYIYKDNIIVARTNSGDFVALSKVCPHQGATVEFQAANNRFYCPSHGSAFSTSGTVTTGPATSGLQQYKTEYNSAANTVRVFS
jgi:cytochrome b6-f complex iron-sulfur subunit